MYSMNMHAYIIHYTLYIHILYRYDMSTLVTVTAAPPLTPDISYISYISTHIIHIIHTTCLINRAVSTFLSIYLSIYLSISLICDEHLLYSIIPTFFLYLYLSPSPYLGGEGQSGAHCVLHVTSPSAPFPRAQ